nr:hypothetical protein [Candidatus Sigynarchaeota archaeon]
MKAKKQSDLPILLIFLTFALVCTSLVTNKPVSDDATHDNDVFGNPGLRASANLTGVRVAVLNEAGAPGFTVQGTLSNTYSTMVTFMASQGATAAAVTSANIASGALANYDVFIMVDNIPLTSASTALRTAWQNGLSILAFDSSIEGLCYYGILPAASQSSNGYSTYWTYGTGAASRVDLAHPITAGYTVGNTISGTSGDAYWINTAMAGVAEAPRLTTLCSDNGYPARWTVLLYEPATAGKVVVFWDQSQAGNAGLQTMIANAVNFVCDSNPPVLSSGTVTPSSGSDMDLFTFSVLYTDVDNDPPTSITVIINGTAHGIAKQNASDVNYADGCIYQYPTYLATGSYTYFFNCSSGRFTNATTAAGLIVSSSGTVRPVLMNPTVNPARGTNTTTFNFTVEYFHPTNVLPAAINVTINSTIQSMIAANAGDTNVADGKIYYYATALPWGFYQFRMNCSDGTVSNSTLWTYAPEVNPFFMGGGSVTLQNVAIFQNLNPWGYTSNQQVLTAHGITYTIYSSASLGVVSLAPFNKVIVASVQDVPFQTALQTVGTRNWFESYVASGGILEIHAVTQSPNLVLPCGYGSIYNVVDALTINVSFNTHPIVSGHTNTEIDGWNSASHNYITGLQPGDKALIYDDTVNHYPRLVTAKYGSGLLILSGMTLEFGWGYTTRYSDILDSVIMFSDIGGVSNVVLVAPVNNTTVFNGNINFTWSSIKPSFGTITYEWQISSSSTFSPILDTVTGIPETAISTRLLHLVNFTTGQYYWRVRGNFGTLHSNWSTPFVLNLIHNAEAPALTSGAVDPSSGNQFTSFNFTVVYSDVDNDPPVSITVIINGTSHAMQKQNPADINYTDGCLYQYQTILFVGGNYVYNFACDDGRFTNATANSTGPSVVEINTSTPWLSGTTFTPSTGTNQTVYTFSVIYHDADNNFPRAINVTINGTVHTMNAVNVSDTNVIDGKLYSYTTTLTWGIYQFRVNCSDSLYANSTAWLPGPVVNPFNILSDVLFYDNFDDGSLGMDWTLTGMGGVSTQTCNSSPYSAYHNGNAGSITSRVIALNGRSNVNISYWIRRGGSFSEHPDASGEDLVAEYYNNIGTWVQLDFFAAGGTQGEIFTVLHVLPLNALHANFQVRFRQLGGSGTGFDYWHIDDVLIKGIGSRVMLLAPLNASTRMAGNMNFSWSSMQPPFGPVNYTWQISNRSDFATIVNTVSNILETPTTTLRTINVDYAAGTYYWRVMAVYGVFTSNWSVSFALILFRNDFAPALTSGAVTPPSGDQFTSFTFNVTYTDLDNNAPASINVSINGTVHAMTKQNPADMNYTDGCVYQYVTTLVQVTTVYNYSFSCYDGRFINSTITLTGPTVIERNLNAPVLSNAAVSPTVGMNTTIFNFTATYTDADNNLPRSVNVSINGTVHAMIAANPADTNVMDGKVFYYTTTLIWGYYQFWINCSDGGFQSATSIVNAPIVDPFSTLTGSKQIKNVAIFRNALPWGYNEVATHLTALGITYTVYTSASFGVVSLAPYDKVIIESNQLTAFYTALTQPSVRAWLEAYVSSGGVLQMHFWHYDASHDLPGTLPGGYTDLENTADTIAVNASYASHPIMAGITGAGLSGLGSSSESYLTGLTGTEKRLAYDSALQQPRLFTRVFGSGLLIYVGLAIEYGAYNNRGNYNTLLDNLLRYGEGMNGTVALISPANNTSRFNINIPFTWNNLGAPFGPIKYHWQISSSPSFSSIALEFDNIAETPTNTSITAGLASLNGTYYWRVHAIYDVFSGNWSKVFVLTVIPNNAGPALFSGSVNPPTGTQSTAFNFTVLYSDADNNAPQYVNVSINGTSHAMQKQNPADANYADGCLYQYTTLLVPGFYSYSFSCNDGLFTDVTGTQVLVVTESNVQAPWLSGLSVTPAIGINVTVFNFTAVYNDIDNNMVRAINISINGTLHTMIAANVGDTNVIDGKLYYYATTLLWGMYQFRVNCYDGGFSNSSAWLPGPEVNPFINAYSNSTIFFEDFENDTSKWSTVSGLWHITGTWPKPWGDAWTWDPDHSPTHAAWCGSEATGMYTNSLVAELITVPFDLRTARTAYLEFYHWMYTESNWDYCRVYIRPNSGSSWTQLYVNSGTVAPWQKLTYNISAYCGASGNAVQIRFYFSSDGSNTYRGWIIDDVKVFGLRTSPLNLLNPANGSSMANGSITFSWTSMAPTFGTIVYDWQISASSSFTIIATSLSSIPESPSTTNIIENLGAFIGQYYWRVRPVYQGLHGNWSTFFSLRLYNAGVAPTLTDAVVGRVFSENRMYRFSIVYTDADNDAPTTIYVTLDSMVYAMQKVNVSDTEYSDGCIYYTEIRAGGGPSHDYRFTCSDGIHTVRTTFTVLIIDENLDVFITFLNQGGWIVIIVGIGAVVAVVAVLRQKKIVKAKATGRTPGAKAMIPAQGTTTLYSKPATTQPALPSASQPALLSSAPGAIQERPYPGPTGQQVSFGTMKPAAASTAAPAAATPQAVGNKTVVCPGCGATFVLKPDYLRQYAGMAFACPKCNREIPI